MVTFSYVGYRTKTIAISKLNLLNNVIELEPEIETDIEWFGFENTTYNFNLTLKEKKVQFQEFSNFYSKKIIPLYDLYCNWKFHLS